MTIKEVSERFGVSTDTLRYYERIGLIPQIARTAGGIRDYTESDIGWVEHTICMRNAGVPIEALLTKLKQNHDTVITLEDGILDGGFGEKIARFYGASNMKVMNYGLKKEFLDRYNVDAVLKDNHLTAEQIVEDVLSIS